MMFEPPEPSDYQHEEILAELGRAIYKLLFQLLLLIDSCNKMLSAVTTAAKAAQVTYSAHTLNLEIDSLILLFIHK